jgi:hypothetical protein
MLKLIVLLFMLITLTNVVNATEDRFGEYFVTIDELLVEKNGQSGFVRKVTQLCYNDWDFNECKVIDAYLFSTFIQEFHNFDCFTGDPRKVEFYGAQAYAAREVKPYLIIHSPNLISYYWIQRKIEENPLRYVYQKGVVKKLIRCDGDN